MVTLAKWSVEDDYKMIAAGSLPRSQYTINYPIILANSEPEPDIAIFPRYLPYQILVKSKSNPTNKESPLTVKGLSKHCTS